MTSIFLRSLHYVRDDAADNINNKNSKDMKVSQTTPLTLTLSLRAFWTALTPHVVGSLPLFPDRLRFFADNCETFRFANKLYFDRKIDVDILVNKVDVVLRLVLGTAASNDYESSALLIEARNQLPHLIDVTFAGRAPTHLLQWLLWHPNEELRRNVTKRLRRDADFPRALRIVDNSHIGELLFDLKWRAQRGRLGLVDLLDQHTLFNSTVVETLMLVRQLSAQRRFDSYELEIMCEKLVPHLHPKAPWRILQAATSVLYSTIVTCTDDLAYADKVFQQFSAWFRALAPLIPRLAAVTVPAVAAHLQQALNMQDNNGNERYSYVYDDDDGKEADPDPDDPLAAVDRDALTVFNVVASFAWLMQFQPPKAEVLGGFINDGLAISLESILLNQQFFEYLAARKSLKVLSNEGDAGFRVNIELLLSQLVQAQPNKMLELGIPQRAAERCRQQPELQSWPQLASSLAICMALVRTQWDTRCLGKCVVEHFNEFWRIPEFSGALNERMEIHVISMSQRLVAPATDGGFELSHALDQFLKRWAAPFNEIPHFLAKCLSRGGVVQLLVKLCALDVFAALCLAARIESHYWQLERWKRRRAKREAKRRQREDEDAEAHEEVTLAPSTPSLLSFCAADVERQYLLMKRLSPFYERDAESGWKKGLLLNVVTLCSLFFRSSSLAQSRLL